MNTGFRAWQVIRCVLALWLAVQGTWVFAQSIVHDIEPNNTPDTLQPIAGAVRIMGTMAGQDQDGFLWTVDESERLQPWTFTLQGIPGALTVVDIIQLQYAEDGRTLTGTKKFLTIGSRDGARPVVYSGLLFEPGEYVLGFARAGLGGSRPPMSAAGFAEIGQAMGEQAPTPQHDEPTNTETADDQTLPANGYRLDITADRELRGSKPQAAGTPREKAPELRRNDSRNTQAAAQQSWYRFKLDEKAAEQRWDLAFQTAVGWPLKIGLQDTQGTTLASTSVEKDGLAQLPDLSLPPGEYFLLLESAEGATHAIGLASAGLKVEGEEAEPNNEWKAANRVDLFQGVNGRLQVDRDTDVYRFELTEAQVDQRLALTLETDAENRYTVCLLDDSGRNIRCRDPQGAWSLGDLALEAGQYGLKIERGTTGMAYRLKLQPDGKHDAGREAEPNESRAWANTILLGKRVRGSFDVAEDTDFYRIDVEGAPQLWRFQINGDQLNEFSYYDGRGRKMQSVYAGVDQKRVLLDNLLLAPGTHYLSIRGKGPGDYTLLSRAQGEPEPNAEMEPNGTAATMQPLAMGQTRTGGFHDTRDEDMYYFHLAAHEHIRLNFQAPIDADTRMTARLHWEGEERKRLDISAGEEASLEGVYPPGSYVLTLETNKATEGRYRAGLQRLPRYACSIDCEPDDNASVAETVADLSALELKLELPVNKVAAYAMLGQQLEGAIRLHNTGEQSLDLALETDIGDLRWQVELQERSITLPAGAAHSIPLKLHIPDDARAVSVRLSARATHASGAQVHADTLVDVLSDAPLVQPDWHWSVPDALRGGLNLAAASLGGEVQTEGVLKYYRNSASLIDGEAGGSKAFEHIERKLPDEPSVTVALAGDGSQPIAGFALHPGNHGSMLRAPRQFSVALSNDGEQFNTVLEGVLEPVRREQYFVLPEAHTARFARLTLPQNQKGQVGGRVALGQWRVIAQPGVALPGETAFNLAYPRHGGHLVHISHSQKPANVWIDPDTKTSRADGTFNVKPGQVIDMVLGFHENRAALIDRIVWGKPRGDNTSLADYVDVEVSLQGPVGPWTPLGRLQPVLEQDAEWRLPEPVWARYMRFTLAPMGEKARHVAVPTSIRVYEAPTDDAYRSVVGVWSAGSQAVYESMLPAPLPPVLDTQTQHVRRDAPQTLEVGQPVSGQVQLGNQEHWYHLRVPEGTNQLDIKLSDPLYLKAALAAETPAGEPVLLMPMEPDGNQRHWALTADPGSEFLIKVYEPPRNVIFAWDTSGSVAQHHEQIYNAMGEYARGLQPGRDMANLLPFGGVLQLKDWQGDPYLMLQAVNEHQGTDSSLAESTLVTATRALDKRSGSRAVVLITDAETPVHKDLWPTLAQGRPQIMAVALNSAAGGDDKRRMLNWSRVNGGQYSFAHDVNDMAQAFERTSVLLRQPAPYQLLAEASFVEPPADGSLQLVAAKPAPGNKKSIRPGPATAIILDASGSMLQRLDGERRIEVAKRGLMQAIAGQIPAGTPVSLRVFGHKEADSCRSDLEIPLQPLDVPAARKVISRIQARNLARTPIADSLALVREDLAQAQGPRTIVLVTDGEETCDGDPEAVIRQLVDDGYDVRLNIIGFALNDPILEHLFGAWAQLGGGEYFSAADKQSFDQAVGKALQVNYTVVDAAGKEIAHGLVDGDPVAVPPGDYQVRVGLVPELVLEARVETEQATLLEVK